MMPHQAQILLFPQAHTSSVSKGVEVVDDLKILGWKEKAEVDEEVIDYGGVEKNERGE